MRDPFPVPRHHDAIRGVALHSACIRGHHPDTRFPIIIVFKSGIVATGIVGHASSPIYFVMGRARSREGVSRKSVTVPCADRFRHLLRGSNHDRVIIFLDFDWNTWRDGRSRTPLSLSLSLMIFFRFLGFIDDSKFDPISGWGSRMMEMIGIFRYDVCLETGILLLLLLLL